MTSSSSDYVRKLMSRYRLEIDSESDDKHLACVMCSKLVFDAYQTHCECLYCHECIVGYLSNGLQYCLGGKEECKEEHIVLERNVFKNTLFDRKVMKAKVHCPNKSCSIIIKLIDMEEHLKECDLASIDCPFSMVGCDTDGAPKEVILDHLNNDVIMHTQLLIDIIHNLKNEVNIMKEDIVFCKLEILSLREDLRIKDIQMGDLKREASGQLLVHESNIHNQETEIENQKAETEKIQKEMELTKRDTEKNESTVIRSINDVRTRVGELAELIASVNVGTNTKVAVGQLSFTVDRFSARKVAKEEVISPYFYSHTNGYKLRLKMFPGGIDDGRGTHFTVSSVICKGEYDDILPWPCRHTFTISIDNHCDGGTFTSWTHNYATTEEDLGDTFYKPINIDNRGLAYPKFVSHVDLRSVVGLTVDDSVIVRCVVSATS